MRRRLTNKEYEKLGRMVEDIATIGFSNTARMFWLNFVKGVAYGLGLFLAGTLVVGGVIWVLGLFDHAPLIGPLIQNIIDNLK